MDDIFEHLAEDETQNFNCCENCTCGDNCTCDSEHKCCDECTCDETCNCKCDEKCDCVDKCECDNCDCKQNNDCNCGQTCDCEQDASESNCEVEDDVENEKCKCGCGEELEQSDIYFGQLLSLRAEFDNYRKRAQEDISRAYKNGFNDAITQFIPALDSFKMASEYITDQNTLVGIQYIEKGILSTLEKLGITVIDTTGKFNPDFHQAIGSEVKVDAESGDIIKECFKGFKMGDKVIRYAQVMVAK